MPKRHDILIDEIPINNNLAHWVSKDYPLKVDEKLNVDKLISRSRLPGLSHNMLPPSKKHDVLIKFEKNSDIHGFYWKVGSDPPTVKRSDYHYDYKSRNYFFIRIQDLCYEDYYSNPANEATKDYKFKIRPVHKPLNANYSHFELQIESDDGEIDSKRMSNSGWAKLIGNSIRDRYKERAFFNLNLDK